MKNNQTKNNFCENKNHSHGQSQVKQGASIFEVCEIVKGQIEADCFYDKDKNMVDEIALIIAEVFCLPGESKIRIAGSDLTASLVADIYRKITGEHVETVIKNFRNADYEIKHKKTYLRTALYNSVFENQSNRVNAVKGFF